LDGILFFDKIDKFKIWEKKENEKII
jgi:hypothetical protein